MNEVVAVALWYLSIQAFALAAIPFVMQTFHGLPDRGVGLSKMAGWLIVSLSIWLLGMLGFVQLTRATIIVVLLIVGGVCWWRWGSTVLPHLKDPSFWRTDEIVFAVAFIGTVWVRAHTPDIVGQEKFMDYAIMNSFLSHGQLPAPDPWLAGYGMPYYHLLYFMFALTAKLAGPPGPISYNLAVATVFALGAAGLCSIATNVIRVSWPASKLLPVFPGCLAPVFVLVLGNLEAVFEILAIRNVGSQDLWAAVAIKGLNPGQASAGWWPADGGWWWRASRVVPTTKPDGINEFPYFSFLLGDLHPHYMAIPLDLLVLALAITVLVTPAQLRSWPWRVLSALSIGALIPANTWDVPVFWGIFLICGALASWRLGALKQGLLTLVALHAVAIAGIAPYLVGYASQPLGIGIVDEHTPVASFLVIFGGFVLVTIVWLLLPPPKRVSERPTPQWITLIPIVGAALAVIASVVDLRTLGFVAVLGACCLHRLTIMSFWDPDTDRPALAEMTVALTFTVGYLVIAGTEILFIRDSFGTRMNTVFKFHYNAWLLLATGSALAIAALLAQRGVRRVGAIISALFVLLLGGIYPLGATLTKTNHFQVAASLDGSAFARRQYENDLIAIDWLRTQAQARSVVAEAVGGDYTDYGRVSTFSGVPTPMGWVGHELQWRGPIEELGRRERLVQELYQSRDADQAQRTLDALGATHVFIGRFEREKYGAENAERLRTWLPLAFQRGDAMILQRMPVAQR